jgi:hypothetical protein
MNRSDTCVLVNSTYEKDEYGVMQKTETTAEVFCDVTSVSASEWFEGGRNGLNPEKRIKMFLYDYDGEKIVEVDGVRFTVYRTYVDRDEIELYLEKRKGNEGESREENIDGAD